MSVRTWMLSQLARFLGDDEGDPNELVELTSVQQYEGPLIGEVLARHGIRAGQVDVYDGVTGLSKVSLRVSRAEFDSANQVLIDFRQT